MFNALKVKAAARKMERRNEKKRTAGGGASFFGRVWHVICAPFCAVWRWICCIDLIGLVNITLLCAIIVLFSMLIMDFVGYNKKPVVIIKQNPVPEINVCADNHEQKNIVRSVKKVVSLPMERDIHGGLINEPVIIKSQKIDPVVERQTARVGRNMYGDIIIDSDGAAPILRAGDVVNGNLYIQHIRKFILPRGVVVRGNLFLRNLGMLQFAGEFTVTGNIYVTPDSSFGPIPRNARIGGQVIL